jgi:pimeloyl-ACP methyl ester carboxylesterase
LRIENYSITVSPAHLALLMELWVRAGFTFPHGLTDHSVIRLALEDLISRGALGTLREFLTRSGLQRNAEAFAAILRMAEALPASYDAAAFTARHDPDAEFEYFDRPEGAGALIVVFTGNAHRVGFPLPLVHGLFEAVRCPVLYLKDKTRTVFCDGLGDGGGRAALIARIRQKMDQAGVERCILVGSSSGTYAALHYAHALSASHVMGLAGPTRIDAADTRPPVQRLRDRITAVGLPFDALEGFGTGDGCCVRYYYGGEHPRDTDFARHLVQSGAGEAVAVRGHANHVVLDVISGFGFFQADLAAAVAGGPFTDPSVHPALILHPKAAP